MKFVSGDAPSLPYFVQRGIAQEIPTGAAGPGFATFRGGFAATDRVMSVRRVCEEGDGGGVRGVIGGVLRWGRRWVS